MNQNKSAVIGEYFLSFFIFFLFFLFAKRQIVLERGENKRHKAPKEESPQDHYTRKKVKAKKLRP